MRTRPHSARRPAPAAAALVVAAAITAAPAAVASDPPRTGLRAPVAAPLTPVTAFDLPAERWMAGHRGVDLAADPAEVIRAPADGTVSFAGSVAGRPVLAIDHGEGLRTTYEPVRASVREGEAVAAGQPVGLLLVGHPGCPVAACLHWGARRAAGGPSGDDDEYLDPLSLLSADRRPIRLKPLRPGDGSS